MIGTMTDTKLLDEINKCEGAKLLAIFMALYSYHIGGDKKKNVFYFIPIGNYSHILQSVGKSKRAFSHRGLGQSLLPKI